MNHGMWSNDTMNYKTDYYKILGIYEDADKKTIKKAYKKLALKYHPDINNSKNAEKKFKRINEAYTVLYDDEERKKYDSYRLKYIQQSTRRKTDKSGSPVKKESSPHRKRRRKRSKTKRKTDISKYINLATRLEEDYGLISGIIGLAVNKGSRNSPAKQGLSTLMNSKRSRGGAKHRHRHGR